MTTAEIVNAITAWAEANDATVTNPLDDGYIGITAEDGEQFSISVTHTE